MTVPIIQPVDPGLIQAELTGDRYVCSLKGIDLYIVTAHDAPNTMNEIGRIREREFRAVGAGRNVAADIDGFDTAVDGCRQLVAWDPAAGEIVAMYRFAVCRDVLARHGVAGLRTAGLFHFDPAFVDEYLLRSIELARSVVNKEARRAVMGLFAVWQGLGALTNEYPDVAYFFGNATVYRSMSPRGRDLVIAFLRTHYAAPAGLVRAKPSLAYTPTTSASEIEAVFQGIDAAADQRRLVDALAEEGEAVPPILLSYLGVTAELMVFDVAVDPDFADAYEIALAIPIESVNQKTRGRFVDGYTRAPGGYFDR